MEIAGARLSQIADVKNPTRIRWAKAGLLNEGSPLGELDLIEAVVLAELVRKLGMDDARIAWADVRPELRRLHGDRLDIVYDIRDHSAHVIADADELYSLAASTGPVRLLCLANRLRRARDAARRVGKAPSREAAHRTGRGNRVQRQAPPR